MKILLDECVPKDLQQSFPNHSCSTVPKAGLAGKKNGELLKLAEQAGFDLIITVDQGLRYQQNLTGRKLAVLIVMAKSNKLADLLSHVQACMEALRSIRPGEVVPVG